MSAQTVNCVVVVVVVVVIVVVVLVLQARVASAARSAVTPLHTPPSSC